MARPENTNDVVDRTEVIATFMPEKFTTTPKLLHAYAQFVDTATERLGGNVIVDHGCVTVTRHRTDDELVDQLKRDQSDWDMRKRWYDQLTSGEEFKYPGLIQTVREWAAAEGLPDLPEDAGKAKVADD